MSSGTFIPTSFQSRVRKIIDSLKIPRLHWQTDDIDQFLEGLQARLSLDGNIVSARGQQLTLQVFGEPLSPQQVVHKICEDVRRDGLVCLLRYTNELDGKSLNASEIRVPESEMKAAHRAIDTSFLEAIRAIRTNLEAYQKAILHQDISLEPRPGVHLTHRYTPLQRVGICVPGGAAAYPSSLLMTAVPAMAAGVPELVVVAPPTPFGAYNDKVLATCYELGIENVYRVGGAQAVAAMAFGVDGIPAVDKIVGPGNLFVALAKKYVYGHVDIDSIAGPSEVLILADDTADPSFVAADLLAQAEHSPGSAILLTPDSELPRSVLEALESQLGTLSRADLSITSLNQFSGLIQVRDMPQAVSLANRMAPEHLHIQTRSPRDWVPQLTRAGAIFVGHGTPVALGDYVAGPSHVLPTGATARWASGLSSNDFLRPSSVIQYDPVGLLSDGTHAKEVARSEGLSAHEFSVELRMKGESDE
ncbi:MAG: histidinol dehydrogenase [Mariniblastus sp.]|nr:histidinol dehydrogenase [Mariniblastus sp.]